MLDQLGAIDRGRKPYRRRRFRASRSMHRAIEFLIENRAIDFLELLLRLFVVHSHDNAIRMQEIFDRRTFTQEFRIGGYLKCYAAFSSVDGKGALEFLARLRGNRTFFDD